MLRWLQRSQRGQSLAELAVVLPVLLILVLGCVDLGRIYFAYISVTSAARNGARYAATGPETQDDYTGIRDAALEETSNLLDTTETNPDVTVTTGSDTLGRTYAEVTVNYQFNSIFPWPGLPGSVNVERTVRAMVAR